MRQSVGVGMKRCGSMPMLFGVAALWAVVAGCSGKSADFPDLAPVSGTITMDGEPLANASVTFESEKGATSFATTDAEGKYVLAYKGPHMGAGIGGNVVRVTTALDAPPDPRWRDPIPAIYNEKSELTATVAAGENVFDFALESKPVKK
jgi:hypothetical protein